METRNSLHPDHVKTLSTEDLRKHFLVENIFTPEKMTATYSHYDRIIFGGIVPIETSLEINPEIVKTLTSAFFLERREMGIINIGGNGKITIDGVKYEIQNEEALYIGRGAKEIFFESVDPKNPAKFYYNSAPAHTTFPTKKITLAEASPERLGAQTTSNLRTIYKYIVPGVADSCQLLMGMTKLDEGNLWNTFPPHTHDRRMEVYFYFNMQDSAVFHMMGQPQETRHIIVRNEEAVISPNWSIHSGVGTAAYTFIWGMVGENQTFSDMDKLTLADLS